MRRTALVLPQPRPARLWLPRLALWRRVAHERRQLAVLDERMLRDIGLTRTAAKREAARPFWDLRGRAIPRAHGP